MPMTARIALRVEGISVAHPNGLPILEDVSFELPLGSILGIVGESGCGKTTLLHSLLNLLPTSQVRRGGHTWLRIPQALVESTGWRIKAGAWLRECTGLGWAVDLQHAPARVCQLLFGDRIAMVPQDVHSSLDPLMTVQQSVAEIIRAHGRMSWAQARERAIEGLVRAGLERQFVLQRCTDPPTSFSGGQRQRVLIAQAIANQPSVVLYDEPTVALDAGTRNHVLGNIRQLVGADAAAVIVSHDLASLQSFADTVCIMYRGRIVESGPTHEVFSRPQHPYTQALLDCMPRLDRRQQMLPIRGVVSQDNTVNNQRCQFSPRCERAIDRCHNTEPRLIALTLQRKVACHAAV